MLLLACNGLKVQAAEAVHDLTLLLADSDNELERSGETNLNADYSNRVYGIGYVIYEDEASSIGLIGIIGEVDLDYSDINKTLDVESDSLGIDFRTIFAGWDMRTLLSVANGDYKTVETVINPFGPDQTITGRYDGEQIALYFELGYAFEAEAFQVRPHVSWFHSQYEQDGYRERASGGGGTIQPRQTEQTNRYSIGVSFTQEMMLAQGQALIFYQMLQYARETEKNAPNGSFDRQIPVAGSSFLPWTENLEPPTSLPSRSTVEYEFGVSYLAAPNATLSFSYSGLSNKDLNMDFFLLSYGIFL